MAGAAAALPVMGGVLGGIGDIIQSQNYHRPRLPPAVGPELRLRQLAQDQLLAGGQQLLGGTALYNQMVPMLMSQLPGMSYVPGAQSTGGDTSLGGVAGAAGGGGSPMDSYQDALAKMQATQARAQQLTALNRQITGMKKAGPQRHALKQQQKALKKQIDSSPTAAQQERATYLSGVQPASSSIYDIRMPGQGGGLQGQSSAGMGDMGIPAQGGSMEAIRGLMDGITHGQPSPPNLMDLYQQSGGY